MAFLKLSEAIGPNKAIGSNIDIGNKARSLADLQAAGFHIPTTYVLPVNEFMKWEASAIIDLARDLAATLARHPDIDRWAVRSSSTREDSNGESFAGLFTTHLDLRSADAIEQAIVDCWSSCRSERVRDYCARWGLPAESIQMAVILQEFIDPSHAGVAFTLHPLSGEDQEFLVELVMGCGEKLVSGLVNPTRFRLARHGTPVVLFREGPSISGVPLTELRDDLRAIQALKGHPQDVEFAVRDGKIVFLQSRDITRVQFTDEIGEWTTADLRDGGVSSSIVSPLMWSLYENILQLSMPQYLRDLRLITARECKTVRFARLFYGRPYWNLGFIRSTLARIPGFKERGFDEDLAITPTYEGDGQTTPVTIKGVLKALPTLFRLARLYRRQMRIDRKLIEEFQQIEKDCLRTHPSALDERSLANHFRYLCFELHPRIESNYFRTLYNCSNAKMDLKSALQPLCERDPELSFPDLISDLGALQVLGPIEELWSIRDRLTSDERARALDPLTRLLQSPHALEPHHLDELPEAIATELKKFIARFYFHSERELDLRVPRWSEDIRFPLQILVQILEMRDESRHPARVAAHRHAVHANALTQAESAIASLSPFRKIAFAAMGFKTKLNRFRKYAWMREEMRDRSTRVYHFIRAAALEIARRWENRHPEFKQGEIFNLSFRDIQNVLDGRLTPAEAMRIATVNRLYADGFRRYKNPNEIGARYVPISSSTALAPRPQFASKAALTLKGIACSRGLVEGTARVITDLRGEASTLKPGDILIAPFTDPGWTPLFSIAAGVVTETGGLLSHAALISREYAMPCVLNVPGVTGKVTSGQRVLIDGTKGLLHVLPEDPAPTS